MITREALKKKKSLTFYFMQETRIHEAKLPYFAGLIAVFEENDTSPIVCESMFNVRLFWNYKNSLLFQPKLGGKER